MTTPLGDALTRWTIRVALAFAVAALATRFFHRNHFARLTWTVGCLLYLAHVITAFHFFHEWSHDSAYRATARDTAALFGLDWGGGLYFNYAFTCIWMADVAWSWTEPASYETRPRWANAIVYGFFVFMAFNGAVVFATGIMRWTSTTAFAVLLFLYCYRCWKPSGESPHRT